MSRQLLEQQHQALRSDYDGMLLKEHINRLLALDADDYGFEIWEDEGVFKVCIEALKDGTCLNCYSGSLEKLPLLAEALRQKGKIQEAFAEFRNAKLAEIERTQRDLRPWLPQTPNYNSQLEKILSAYDLTSSDVTDILKKVESSEY